MKLYVCCEMIYGNILHQYGIICPVIETDRPERIWEQ